MASRLLGQEVEIRVTQAGVPLTTLNAISSTNDSTILETKQDGFLGEVVDRFDDLLKGYSIDFEAQVSNSSWIDLELAIVARARRETPDMLFNIIRTDFYSDGSSIVYNYMDVKFGPIAKTTASRADFVKVKFEGKCSERPVQKNAIT
jgi:hypothetical protein